jgi:hypothetical protein
MVEFGALEPRASSHHILPCKPSAAFLDTSSIDRTDPGSPTGVRDRRDRA